ncbi:TPR repeat protein 26 [Intoshia linei]|uniref:TPR repeat protein 26 n=1 Tax=Intoshia linei TaxID=1819745 RepID=A0A177B8A3_9BILA|nr:TPR repeat protein 26 [Intoshia linei]
MRLDYYNILQINQSSVDADIKKAYRKLALKWHPYKNEDYASAIETFTKLAEAYEILVNPKTRQIYDLYGEDSLKNGVPFQSEEGQGWYKGYVFHNDPYFTFKQFFGGDNPFQEFYNVVDREKNFNFGNVKALKPKVQDSPVIRNIELTLEELYHGCLKKMKISRRVLNEDGHTSHVRDKILNINVEKGWQEGTKVIFKNESDQGPNSIPADVIFNIEIMHHQTFQRSENDLIYTAKIKLSQALCGLILNIETLDKRILSIPINHIVTPSYKKIVNGEGMPIHVKNQSTNEYGNLIILLSRSNVKIGESLLEKDKDLFSFEDYVEKRDYSAAITLLNFHESFKPLIGNLEEWLAYCNFHAGDYNNCLQIYEKIQKNKKFESKNYKDFYLNYACVLFMMGEYEKVEEIIKKEKNSPLRNRLAIHVYNKLIKEREMMEYHGHIENVVEDKLTMAAVHYLRTNFQDSIDIYKRLLLENRENYAIHFYVAQNYYKMEYFELSQECLANYLRQYSDSIIALNLKACNLYKLFKEKAAENIIYEIFEKLNRNGEQQFCFAQDLLNHNLVVFRNGEGALNILPKLIHLIPEAKFNLIIYYLKNNVLDEAQKLVNTIKPKKPIEYTLHAILNVMIGQQNESRQHLKMAQQYFQVVGGSKSECDTIQGRQATASCYLLLRQFDNALLYMTSIKTYFTNDDVFSFNMAQAKAGIGRYDEAEETFLLIQDEQIKREYTFISWLVRCYIMLKKPRLAWELYLKTESTFDSFKLLELIANDCYKMGHFFYAAKAFDELDKMDSDNDFWVAKRGACIGAFQMAVAQKDNTENQENLKIILDILNETNTPQSDHISLIIKGWLTNEL